MSSTSKSGPGVPTASITLGWSRRLSTLRACGLLKATIRSPSQWNQTGTRCGRPSAWTELSQTTGSSAQRRLGATGRRSRTGRCGERCVPCAEVSIPARARATARRRAPHHDVGRGSARPDDVGATLYSAAHAAHRQRRRSGLERQPRQRIRLLRGGPVAQAARRAVGRRRGRASCSTPAARARRGTASRPTTTCSSARSARACASRPRPARRRGGSRCRA